MRLPIAAILMIGLAGIMFFLYVGFNEAFHGEGMLRDQLWDSANRTMDGRQLEDFNRLMPQLRQGFGITMVICFGLAIVFFVVWVFHKPPQAGDY